MEPLTPHDKCDAGCPTRAWVKAQFRSGTITLCAHHGRVHMPALVGQAVEVVDRTQDLWDEVEAQRQPEPEEAE